MERYGFYGRLSRDFPSQINVDLTQVCNLRCRHCPYADFSKSVHNKNKMLSFGLNKKMVDEVAQYGKGLTQYIRYTGNGEPLLHKKCIDILDYAVKNSNSLVTLTTNGTLLTHETICRLLDTKLYLVDISIDAHSAESYKQIRGGNYELVKNNVLNLIAARDRAKSKTKIVTNLIEQPLNDGEALPFKKFWQSQGVDYVVIRQLHSAGNNKSEIAAALNEIKTSRKPCLYPWERILLNAEGMLSFCPVDWTGGAVINDYRVSSIKDIWRGRQLEVVRIAHLKNDFTDCEQCKNCPDWRLTNWPNEGRSYADMIIDFSNNDESD